MTLFIRSYDVGPYIKSTETGDTVLSSRPLRALPGDELDADNAVKKRGHHARIFGIVDFCNRTSMGRTNRGVPLYLFHPLDAGYSPFIVGSREKPDTNLFCTVEYVSWDVGAEWPRGGIVTRFGGLSEHDFLLKAATVPEPALTIPEPPTAHAAVSTWDAVFNIDPDGCEDVDDVLAYRVETGGTRWAIGIADVSAWISEESALDRHAALCGQTLYEEGVVVAPMLPNSLSSRLASLRCDGIARPVLSLVLFISDAGVLVSEGFELQQLTVTRAYTYDSVRADSSLCVRIRSLVSSLGSADSASTADSHEWIERIMVYYNTRVAALLRENRVGVLRRLPATESVYEAVAAATGFSEIAHLGKAAGAYCRGDAEGDVSHAGLGVAEYCHATSPLRRYVDLVNQRWVKHLACGGARPNGTVMLSHLEKRASVARHLERDLWFLRHVQPGRISESEGIVLESHGSSHGSSHSVYVPEWRRVLRCVGCVCDNGTRGTVRVFIDTAEARYSKRLVCSFLAERQAEGQAEQAAEQLAGAT